MFRCMIDGIKYNIMYPLWLMDSGKNFRKRLSFAYDGDV